jgi:hypothetical protein
MTFIAVKAQNLKFRDCKSGLSQKNCKKSVENQKLNVNLF